MEEKIEAFMVRYLKVVINLSIILGMLGYLIPMLWSSKYMIIGLALLLMMPVILYALNKKDIVALMERYHANSK